MLLRDRVPFGTRSCLSVRLQCFGAGGGAGVFVIGPTSMMIFLSVGMPLRGPTVPVAAKAELTQSIIKTANNMAARFLRFFTFIGSYPSISYDEARTGLFRDRATQTMMEGKNAR